MTRSFNHSFDLVVCLNELIQKLGIPLEIEAPYELTPTLLIAILESLLRRRLPLSQALRGARDLESKTRAMAVFLEELEDETIEEDAGCSAVDARRLALGEWDETVFVGQVLCWLGSTKHILSLQDIPCPRFCPAESDDHSAPRSMWEHEDSGVYSAPPSPSPLPSASSARRAMPSSFYASRESSLAEDDMNLTSVIPQTPPRAHSPSIAESPALEFHALPSITHGLTRTRTSTTTSNSSHYKSSRSYTPRCIHEVGQSFSQDASTSLCDDMDESRSVSLCECPSGIGDASTTTVNSPSNRIKSNKSEQSAREATYLDFRPQSTSLPPRNASPRYSRLSMGGGTPSSRPSRVITRHTSPTQHTLALLNERTKLLEGLTRLKLSDAT